MKFTIDRKILSNNLSIVSKAISTKSPIPALSGISFNLNQDGLVLIGSNLESSIKCFIPIEFDGKVNIENFSEGVMIINESFISEIVRKVEDEKINFELMDGTFIKVSTKTATFNLNSISSDEYPKVDISKSDEVIEFTKEELKNIVNSTVFTIAKNESRPILTGVNFNCVGNLIVINATDSYRLSHKLFSHKNSVSGNYNIPGKALADLNNILNSTGNVVMHIFTNKVMFEFDNVLFQTNLLEGTYPNTEKLIPEMFETEVEIESKYLNNILDRASILSRDRNKNVVKLVLGENSKIICSSQEVGKVEEDIFVNFIKSGNFEISFSAKYLKEAVNSLDCEKVIVKFNGDMKPFIVCNPDDDSIIQLVLPVRTY